MPTEPMGNAGTGALPKVRACRAAPQNLLDFALEKKKVYQNNKLLLGARPEGRCLSAPELLIAWALCLI
ncbi:hypothetical protein [Pricia antarctica]|uniref:hypothetical protein n=1 Tax=Pricia antarctica TaxID=641691 RepID=UPI001113B1BA|nr:hypothetical protein [Pricia antarctica]